jgi:hypothetical protein
MAQSVLVTLTTAGVDSGPFSLYSDADGYAVPIVTGVSKAALLAGYLVSVPDLATIVKVLSTGVCTNFDLIPISATSTSTTTSTSTSTSTSTTTSTTTSTSTSTSTSTTTSTTTSYCQSIGAGTGCFNWNFTADTGGAIVQWTNCSGVNQSVALSGGESGSACLCDGQTPNVISGSLSLITQVGQCV